MKEPRSALAVCGYLGAHNAGDEAILESLLLRLSLSHVGAVFVFSDDPDATSRLFSTVTALPSLPRGPRTFLGCVVGRRISKQMRALASSRFLIFCGGAIIADTDSSVLKGVVLRALLARLVGCRVILYAVGIDRLSTWWGQWLARLVFALSDATSIREPQAVAVLDSAGVRTELCLVAADPVLNLPPDRRGHNSRNPWLGAVAFGIPQFLHNETKYPWAIQAANQFRNVVAEFADTVAHETGRAVLFVPMQHPCDVEMAESILSRMKAHGDVLREELRPSALMDLFSSFHAVVGMRFHSVVMAAAQNIPFVAISYSHKVAYFADLVGMGEYTVPYHIWLERQCPLTASSLLLRFRLMEEGYHRIKVVLANKVAELRERELQNAHMLARALGGEP